MTSSLTVPSENSKCREKGQDCYSSCDHQHHHLNKYSFQFSLSLCVCFLEKMFIVSTYKQAYICMCISWKYEEQNYSLICLSWLLSHIWTLFLTFFSLSVNYTLITSGVRRENHDTLFTNKCQSSDTFKYSDCRNHVFSRFANTIMWRFGVVFPLSLNCMANFVVPKCLKWSPPSSTIWELNSNLTIPYPRRASKHTSSQVSVFTCCECTL